MIVIYIVIVKLELILGYGPICTQQTMMWPSIKKHLPTHGLEKYSENKIYFSMSHKLS